MDKIVKRLKNLPKKKKIFLIFVVFIVLTIILVLFLFLRKESDGVKKKFGPDEVVTYSTGRPSEREVKEYEVAPDMPRRIDLKSIKKSGYIQMVGVDQNGNIAVPTNVLMAGWYVSSVRPGDLGLSIITGHRDGILKKGVFRYLGDLKKGDEFEIEYGDRSKKVFKVVDSKEVTVEDAYKLMYEKRDNIEKQLNLITCVGTYDKKAQTYDKRILIVSEAI
jgi:LPXTG-site transpeptidase (sortase) family protein